MRPSTVPSLLLSLGLLGSARSFTVESWGGIEGSGFEEFDEVKHILSVSDTRHLECYYLSATATVNVSDGVRSRAVSAPISGIGFRSDVTFWKDPELEFVAMFGPKNSTGESECDS